VQQEILYFTCNIIIVTISVYIYHNIDAMYVYHVKVVLYYCHTTNETFFQFSIDIILVMRTAYIWFIFMFCIPSDTSKLVAFYH
jgi:hypothetical protein